MKISIAAILLFILTGAASLFAQTDQHRWKPLIVNDSQKLWYDGLMLEKASGDIIEMWVLQMHKPPLQFDGIKGDIVRSKTLYAIDLKEVRFGLEEVVYYDAANKEIYKHSYETKTLTGNLKCPYPITEDSYMFALVKEVLRIKGAQKQGALR